MIERLEDERALIEAMARFFVHTVERAVRKQGRCRLALAGGRTPRGLYQRLVWSDLRSQVRWSAVEVFWGDERCVTRESEESNYRMAREALLDHVPVPLGNIHPIDGLGDPTHAAASYAEILGPLPLDLVLLGMGPDGHTASLFPSTPDLRSELRAVVATVGPVRPAGRISVSLRTINAARTVVFMVAGESKADRLSDVMGQLGSPTARLPAAMVNPTKGTLHWFVDDAAASRLKGKGMI